MATAPWTDEESRANRVLLLSVPRSASNLLDTMLSKQPRDISGYYNLNWSMPWLEDLNKGPFDQIPDAVREERSKELQANYEKLLNTIETSEKNGRKTFHKEHITLQIDPKEVFRQQYPTPGCNTVGSAGPSYVTKTPGAAQPEKHTTPFVFPDSFYLKFKPIFTIRHPALMYPSLARAMRKGMGVDGEPGSTAQMTLSWSRFMYEWYTEHKITPVLIDADDTMNSPEAVRELCRLSGLDPDALIFSWETRTAANKQVHAFASTIYNSTGIVKGKDSTGLDLEAEKKKWLVEFGEAWGKDIGRKVDASMEDYLWLKERSIKTTNYMTEGARDSPTQA
ncbi:Hypothetical protein R9X50_00727600 [Acrodontium crateriforme]|uniref:P-loop containing nucleoside triphosphate hydrolase protein n=1 Tax=Acrodontium crateriforme TaxID=150365 RepID=A0AAQ3MB45_9PEZI|nr:Hypothetical protein R9X50_00727600 [Acrodontium crateriforme]